MDSHPPIGRALHAADGVVEVASEEGVRFKGEAEKRVEDNGLSEEYFPKSERYKTRLIASAQDFVHESGARPGVPDDEDGALHQLVSPGGEEEVIEEEAKLVDGHSECPQIGEKSEHCDALESESEGIALHLVDEGGEEGEEEAEEGGKEGSAARVLQEQRLEHLAATHNDALVTSIRGIER